VLDLSGLPMLDVVIGLAFMFFLLSVICSSISEIVASIFRMRAKNLETGIRVLLGNQAKADEFFENWRIDALQTPKWTDSSKKNKSRKPSYIAPETVALAVIDTLAPEAAEAALKNDPGQKASADQIEKIKKQIGTIQDDKVKGWLTHVLDDARGNLDEFRTAIEGRFNEVMDRATGWYKRKTQIILFVIALAVAGGLNADTINVADRLARDEALRTYVVAQAQKAGEADAPATPTAKDVEDQIKRARASGLPLGWTGENIPDYPFPFAALAKIAGIVLTAFAVLLGAPFWFDVLGKVSKLRSSGNRVGTPKDDNLAPTDRDDRLTRRPSAATPLSGGRIGP
jgi:hypothetical protein